MIIGIRNSVLQRIPIKAACNGYYLRWWYNGWHYWFFLPGDHTINTEGERYFTLSTRTITMSSGQVTREQAAAIRTIFFTKEVYLLGIAGWMEIRIEPGSPVIYNNMVAGTEIEITAHIGSREISYTSGYTPVPDLPIVAPSEPVMCELIIGTQIWACYNVETDYPGSKVYGEDEAKRSVFGGLYNWTQVMASGFCPAGWHIPTLAEWQTLIDFLGGDAVAGGHLKSINAIHWNSPNTDADDSVDFSGRGAGVGIVNSFTGVLEFRHLLNYEYFWTADEDNAPWTELSAKAVRLAYDSAAVVKTSGNKLTNYLSVRLIKDSSAELDYTEISCLITSWTDATGWATFTSAGRHIISAINNALSSEYAQSNDISVTEGEYLKITLNVTISAGEEPQFYVWDKDNVVVITGTNVRLSNGVNTIYFQVPTGCTEIYLQVLNVINFGAAVNVNFSLTAQCFDDWFLPSLDELNEMYTALHLFGLGNFKDNGIFDYYWTSTEAGGNPATSAFSMRFSNGSQWESLKSNFNSYYIRPIRRFTAAAGAYSLRGIGQAGGRIFYISGGTTYYEAAQNDIEEKAWSNVTALAVGTTLKIIGEGINNTTEIIAQPGHTASAAKECSDYVV